MFTQGHIGPYVVNLGIHFNNGFSIMIKFHLFVVQF